VPFGVSARAGILVTGTEVLTGRVADRNGPWLSERLRELGVDHAYTLVVGDRREDMDEGLRFLATRGVDVVITSGGLGPTADDLTAEVVGAFAGREMVLDEALEERIAEILRPLMSRWPDLDPEAIRASNRKQAVVPSGAFVLDPVGTAPGLVVPVDGGPTVVVLPGPPRELHAMWPAAVASSAFQAAVAGAVELRQRTLRLFGIPESEIAETLRLAEDSHGLDGLEITTCLRRGEVEVVTRFAPASSDSYARFVETVRARHAGTLFSDDGRTVDEQVADLLRSGGLTIATAESCTGGLLAGRLTELAGSSDYALGGLVVYSNEAKVALAGVEAALIERVGAVSVEVAQALADGARARLGADVGVGITGIAGPGGGTPEKPVGLVCFSVAGPAGARLTRSLQLPGGRADIRDRSTTVAMHLVRRVLVGAPPAPRSGGAPPADTPPADTPPADAPPAPRPDAPPPDAAHAPSPATPPDAPPPATPPDAPPPATPSRAS
jgi:competence/damage-inducible protein CinA-like protein